MVKPFWVLAVRRCALAMLLPGMACQAAPVSAATGLAAAPPPDDLPRVLGECESGPHYNACSVWTWNGSAYTAIWQNAAVGHLVVESADHAAIRVRRDDASGTLKGLSATYTGRWDGHAIREGKMAISFNGASSTLTWNASRAATPVLKDPQHAFSFVNWYPAALTGFAVFTQDSTWNSSVGIEIDDYRLRKEAPMNPGEFRTFTQRFELIPASFASGLHYPQASAVAAIYSDGTTFGDPNVILAMIENRRDMLGALTEIGATLCAMRERQASLQDISSTLEQLQAKATVREKVRKGRALAFSFVQNSLGPSRANAHLQPDQVVRQTWDRMNELRADLAADPVKDGAGNRLIPGVRPLECRAP